MTEREKTAKAELEDALQRLLPELLGRTDNPLLSEWTLVLSTISGDSEHEGAKIDVLAPESALVGHVLGALRIATISVEDEIFA